MYNKNSVPLGPDLPLAKKTFKSVNLFVSFKDRIPSRENPAYEEYCRMRGIDVSEKDPITLLATLGYKGPSSFIFAPVYQEIFDIGKIIFLRKNLKLTVREFCKLFDISLSTLYRIENNQASSREALKRLELYCHSSEAALYEIRKNSFGVNDMKRIYAEGVFLCKDLIEKIITDKKYCIEMLESNRCYPYFSIVIDTAQPESRSPHKRSRRLIFKFRRELIDDEILKQPSSYETIKKNIKNVFEGFDFCNPSKIPYDSPPDESYLVKSDGSVTLIDNKK